MKFHSLDSHLQELIGQCRRVLAGVEVTPGRTQLTSPGAIDEIHLVRNMSTGRVAIFINTASGPERVFAYDIAGNVLVYVASHFWQSELEHWAQRTLPRPTYAKKGNMLYPAYRAAQCAMFGAAAHAGLSTRVDCEDAMRAGIADLLGIALESRSQLTPLEMSLVELALEEGCFNPDWTVRRHIALDLLSAQRVYRIAA